MASVSLQAALSPEERRTCPDLEDFFSRKRKRRDGEESEGNKEAKLVKHEEEDTELDLDAPLPSEWQRCLDLKSGAIHFYNTRTHRRTAMDPRLSSLEPPISRRPRLDLELNLEPPGSHLYGGERVEQDACNSEDDDEMVATACMRCHMLVMMSKASLSCPSCKFVHPPNHSFSALCRPAFKLVCCKDQYSD
ncbi:hypothetical protein OPV22_028160 [Ensete ventricosum]|uniref:WW domain-containing protein n=1 Tax=Ensete ventricosum TaxID=4639 RepID=A0AAV8PXF8_ENSVE|nr:hypothetical protein OPV22_028160 [Ensete ventricosum]